MTIFSGARFFPPQVPSDRLNNEFVFEGVADDDSIVSAVVSVLPNDSTLTVVSTSFTQNMVVVRITGGTAGVTYQINVTATSAIGLVWDRSAMLPVVAMFPGAPPVPFIGPTGPTGATGAAGQRQSRLVYGNPGGQDGNLVQNFAYAFTYDPAALDVWVYRNGNSAKLLPGDPNYPYTARDGVSITFTTDSITQWNTAEFISWL
jgi:hypothetical protein